MSWPEVELIDAVEFIRNGASIKQTDGAKGLPITRIETIWNSEIDSNRFGYADIFEESLGGYADYLLNPGDLLISHINSLKHLGKTAIYKGLPAKVIHGMNLLSLRPKKDFLDSSYAYFYFNSGFFKAYVTRIANQSVNQASFSAGNLKSIKIPLPPLPIQKKIAAVLEKADELRRKREEQIKRLDDLLQATFLDMFGDPVTNPKGWNMVKLGELSHKITDGVHAKPNYTATGKPFISVVNITSGKIVFDNCKFVSEEDYEKFTKVNRPEYGDVLYTKVGTYGIPAFVDVHDDFCLYVSVCLIKPKHDLINSRFLAVSMGMPYVKRQADSRIKGIGVPDLHLNQIREFDICCPPDTLQKKYVDFCNKVDEEKKQLEIQRDAQKSLFNSLMQRAFKGELDLK